MQLHAWHFTPYYILYYKPTLLQSIILRMSDYSRDLAAAEKIENARYKAHANKWRSRMAFPGLGLPIKFSSKLDDDEEAETLNPLFYDVARVTSGLLPVREVAMMVIMDKLSDKPDWHIKVFDDDIVSKWRQEALAYPDEELWNAATEGKFRVGRFWRGEKLDRSLALKGIMSDRAFDYVRYMPPPPGRIDFENYFLLLIFSKSLSVYRNLETKRITSKRPASCQH